MKKSIFNSIGIISYRILLDILYVESLYPVYMSEGYENYSTSGSFLSSWVVLLLFIPIILKLYKNSNFSSNVIALLFLVSYVPMTSMMAFMPMTVLFFILYNIYWFFLLALHFYIPRFPAMRRSMDSDIGRVLWVIIIICSLAIIFVSGYYFGFRITFDLVNVYELRAEVTKSKIPHLFNYILPAAGNILPIILVYFIDKKKRMIVLFLSLIVLLNFSIGGHKAIFFNLILAFLGYFFFKNTLMSKYAWFLSSLVLIAILEYRFFETYFMLGYGIRRLMYVPALLNYQYFSFFDSNEYDYYRQSFMRYFGLNSPYSDTIPHIIGDFMGYPGMGANNGLFSDGFSNLGVLGIFLHPLIIVLIFKLYDKYSYGIESKYMFLQIVACVTIFNSSFFPTALLTHGMLLLMIVLFLFPREIRDAKYNKLKSRYIS